MKLNNPIITFSFDDARYDSYDAIKLAVDNGIACTLNVTTGYVDGSLSKSEWPTIINPMSKEQIVELYRLGVEIAGHGDKHNNDHNSLICGCEKIKEWLCLDKETKIGIASPHSKYHVDESNTKFIEEGFLYCRVGSYLNGISKFKRCIQKLARITGSRALFKLAYNNTVKNAYECYPFIRAVPVLRDNTVDQIKSIIDLCIKKNYLCVLCFHSILSNGDLDYNSNFTWDKDKYSELVDWISLNESIEKLTTVGALEVIKSSYIKE